MLPSMVTLLNFSGLSSAYSPRIIISRTSLDCAKHFKVKFGAYYEVCEGNRLTSTISDSTLGGAMPKPNVQLPGELYFSILGTEMPVNSLKISPRQYL